MITVKDQTGDITHIQGEKSSLKSRLYLWVLKNYIGNRTVIINAYITPRGYQEYALSATDGDRLLLVNSHFNGVAVSHRRKSPVLGLETAISEGKATFMQGSGPTYYPRYNH